MATGPGKKSSVLGLIPAKGGSQRLARKNVLPLGGKPLLQWAVDAALQSGVLDRLIVSTEDTEIAEVARKLGAEVPFLRPAHLAKDPYGVVDVGLHALETLREAGQAYHTLVILLPTCPLRTAEDIAGAYRQFREAGAESLMSVALCDHTPFTALKLEGTRLSHWFPEYLGAKPGGLPAAYRPNGAIHVLDVESFERKKSYTAQPLMGYLMPPERSVDVDTFQDLAMAEVLLAGR
ncbi:MAG TPA: acylneuraminate cytidylyltransferase family protein [Fibrobacteria bacterium]|nr:acylneuraminate cytidylyltransferase family protein [Fibrobacteria bacterium]